MNTKNIKVPVTGKLYSPIGDEREKLDTIENKTVNINEPQVIAELVYKTPINNEVMFYDHSYFQIYFSNSLRKKPFCKYFSGFKEKASYMLFLGEINGEYKFLFKDKILWLWITEEIDFFDVFEERFEAIE